jgi:hypothetical protein
MPTPTAYRGTYFGASEWDFDANLPLKNMPKILLIVASLIDARASECINIFILGKGN